jgi:hypothetical protein
MLIIISLRIVYQPAAMLIELALYRIILIGHLRLKVPSLQASSLVVDDSGHKTERINHSVF